MPESTDVRRKTIGMLIRRVRETSGRSRKDCAAYIGVSPAQMVKIEEGDHEPTLVEMEALAHYLRVPVQALLDEDVADKLVAPRMGFDIKEVCKLRTHIIGTRLKQARMNKELSVKQAAEIVGITTSQLNAYELGKHPIPITDLEHLTEALEITLESLLDLGIGPLGEAQLQHQQHAQFDSLSPEIRAFVADPHARPYLRAAMRLRKVAREDLRDAGQALMDLSALGGE
jgi:transcriptional regulator with XRE-family HTH domain